MKIQHMSATSNQILLSPLVKLASNPFAADEDDDIEDDEIEDDNDKDIKKKVSTKIAPAMSSLLYELDLSQDNEKGIFF